MEKPAWFDDSAVEVENGWMVESEIGEKVRREWVYADGGRRVEFRSPSGALLSAWKFFENGDGSLDFETSIGEVSRYETKDPFVADIFPEFPSKKIEMIRFQMLNVDVEAETFSIGEVLYFDKNDQCVTADLEFRDEPRWYTHPGQDASSEVWVSKHDNGTEKLRIVFQDGIVADAVEKADDGSVVCTRKMAPDLCITVFGDDICVEFIATPDTRRVRVTAQEEVTENIVKVSDIKTAEDFVTAFNTLFGPLSQLSVDIWPRVENFNIQMCEVEEFDDVFKAREFAHNGGGDTLIVIEEPGEYFGNVFSNYHDEGLFSLEMVDEFEFESDDKDEMIEEMPFIRNLIAPTITEAFAMLDLENPEFFLPEMTKIS